MNKKKRNEIETTNSEKRNKNEKQAGAELCQAQFSLS